MPSASTEITTIPPTQQSINLIRGHDIQSEGQLPLQAFSSTQQPTGAKNDYDNQREDELIQPASSSSTQVPFSSPSLIDTSQVLIDFNDVYS